MRTRELEIEFVTPAFLGGANQSSEWRTPPLKAVLRQWWRVWATHRVSRDVQKVREAEGVVFGHAFLRHRVRREGGRERDEVWQLRSPVRLRLQEKKTRKLSAWRSLGRVDHPEVQRKVGADLYLGYGPLTYKTGQGTALRFPPALDAGSRAKLLLGYPGEVVTRSGEKIDVEGGIEASLRLVHLLGTVGGRSRNGWGSLRILENGRELVPLDQLVETLGPYSLPLEEALKTDWPDAIGKDDRGLLLWKETAQSLEAIVKRLAEVKVAFRTALEVGRERSGPVRERHLLGYPVTHHWVKGWSRLASQLRFKMHREGNRYVGLAAHLPCGLPRELRRGVRLDRGRDLRAFELQTWRKVHRVLDREMTRVG